LAAIVFVFLVTRRPEKGAFFVVPTGLGTLPDDLTLRAKMRTFVIDNIIAYGSVIGTRQNKNGIGELRALMFTWKTIELATPADP
jgi:hypothetical protein